MSHAAPVQPANPFEDVVDYYSSRANASSSSMPIEVPTTSIEIPLPAGILDSLPVLGGGDAPATTNAAQSAPERRVTDGLVREVTIPLNLTLDELRQHRRLRLKITLDVNLLP